MWDLNSRHLSCKSLHILFYQMCHFIYLKYSALENIWKMSKIWVRQWEKFIKKNLYIWCNQVWRNFWSSCCWWSNYTVEGLKTPQLEQRKKISFINNITSWVIKHFNVFFLGIWCKMLWKMEDSSLGGKRSHKWQLTQILCKLRKHTSSNLWKS